MNNNEQLLNEVFEISGIIKVEVSVISRAEGRGKCYQPSRRPRLITLTDSTMSMSAFEVQDNKKVN